MGKVLDNLKNINPMFEHIILDKKKSLAFPELLTVLQFTTQCIDFVIQFLKKPLVENYVCKAFSKRLFKPVRIPQSVYDKV